MPTEELNEWADDFEAFHARFAGLFVRSEPREQAVKYMRALMAPVARKNGWQIAEAIGDKTPDATQRLLYQVKWNADAARDELQPFVVETLGDEEEGIGVVDETGFLKKGTKSAGVKRQYTGTAGKTENCQIGVFLAYATPKGQTFLDRRLYLPQEWCDDAERRAEAKIPKEITFQTKPEQAIEMLQHAWEQGVPMRWITGDEVYGDSTALRDAIKGEEGHWYVLAVSSNTPAWRDRPALEPPTLHTGGRPRTKPRLADDAPSLTTVATVVKEWLESQWQRLTVAEGEKGPRIYDWARTRVVESRDSLPGPDAWLLARRSISDPTEIAYYLSNAPAEMPLLKLAQVAASRYVVEQVIEEAKGETGLDEYEVRYWHSWHRHITLSMMAHAWLASIRCKTEEKGLQIQTLPN
jgi:SRSO17 transposase